MVTDLTDTMAMKLKNLLRRLFRRSTFAQIDEYASSGVWDGNLAEMRDDVSR